VQLGVEKRSPTAEKGREGRGRSFYTDETVRVSKGEREK